jgi:hypothetical protein
VTASVREIEIGDHKFQVSRLKVKDSLRGLKLVGKVLLPAIAEASSAPAGQMGDAVTKIVEGLDCLPDLLDLFATCTKVQLAGGTGSFMGLASVVDDAFGGHPDWVVQFLVECVQIEYGAFLKGDGPLSKLLGRAAVKVA